MLATEKHIFGFQKTHSSKANFIAQLVESTNAQFGLANANVLGEAKAVKILAMSDVGKRGVIFTPCKHQWKYR